MDNDNNFYNNVRLLSLYFYLINAQTRYTKLTAESPRSSHTLAHIHLDIKNSLVQ